MNAPSSALSPSLQKALVQAFDHLKAGDAKRAGSLLKKVLRSAPEHADALHGLGLAEKAAGRMERAAGFLERARTQAPGNAAIAANLGNLYREAGRIADAIACYRSVVEAAPRLAAAHKNLGALLHEAGETAAARESLERALALDPNDPDIHNNLGAAVRETEGIPAAVAHFDRALALAPGHADALFNRANALHEAGDRDAAIAGYERTVAIEPGAADAWFNLHALRFDAADPSAAVDALERAVAARPGYAMARAYLAMMLEAGGHAAEARPQRDWIAAKAPDHLHLIESWDYAKMHLGDGVRLFADTYDTLRHAVSAAPSKGMMLEFGVHRGNSIRFIAGLTERTVHGFDSFEGLPEGWKDLPAGSYTTEGTLPEVPDNVALHVGWFDDTLPAFAAANEGGVAFMNVDCDLYNSTVSIFEALGDRIVAGTVIAFDEYVCNPTWRDDEYLAFREFVAARGLTYRYLAFSPFSKQAVVRIG